MTPCPLCEQNGCTPRVESDVRWLRLACATTARWLVLAPTIMPAIAATRRLFTSAEAAGLWREYRSRPGHPRVTDWAHHFAGTQHWPASDCTRCPPAWPIACSRPRGDGSESCGGLIHAVVRGRRGSYDRSRSPAWRDLHLVYAADDHYAIERHGLTLETSCDHCCRPATQMRRMRAQRDLEKLMPVAA